MDKPGDAPVVVITDRFWRDRLNAAPDALGQTLRLNGQTGDYRGNRAEGIQRRDAGAFPLSYSCRSQCRRRSRPSWPTTFCHQRDAKAFQAMMRLRRHKL